MWRTGILLTLLFSLIGLAACQLDAKNRAIVLFSPTDTAAPTPTLTPTPTSISSPTPTATSTPTPLPTPTNTPTSTATPIPSDRLARAQRAYTNGDYETARREFEALLADPGADPNEQRLALHWRGRSELELGNTQAAIATLKMFVQQYPSDELTRAAQFNLGLAYQRAGQSLEAMAAYRGVIIPDDPLNVYIYERIGDLALQAGAYTGAIEAYQAGINATNEPGFHVHLREGIAQAELAQDNPTAAIAQYDAILAISQIKTYRAKILRLAGEAHLAAGDSDAAYKRYLETVNRYPEAYDSYLALVELVNAGVPVDEFQRGLVDYHAGAYQPAIAAFERYLTAEPAPSPAITSTGTLTTTATPSNTAPASPASVAGSTPLPRAEEAIWLTARSWQILGGYPNALAFFQQLIDEYPTSSNWGQAHLEMGNVLIDQDSISQAKEIFRRFAAENPDHLLAPQALWRAARLELDGDLLAEAHTSLVALAQTYPHSDYADDALYWAGQASFKLGNYDQAIETWAELAHNYPDSDLFSFASYWQAKTLLRLGRDDEANEILTSLSRRTLDYYGLRARDLLNSPVAEGGDSLVLPGSTELATEQAEAEVWLNQWLDLPHTENLSAINGQIQNDSAFQLGRALLNIGLREEALLEFETVKEHWWDDALAMYQLSLYFREQGLGRLSIVTAGRLIFLSPARVPEDTPIFIQRLFYPIFFEDVILAEAEAYQLDPTLLLAIIRQESLFEPSAHSPADARGLMQVIPTTGEYVAERGGFANFDPAQLWLPYQNVKLGAWYIKQQLEIFDDNHFAALVAYNAGPGNVLEWVKTSDDLDIFVESIPFWESRLYIRNVYVNLAGYRRLYRIMPVTR
ncbi:MAG: tetratricopeptide repeat protein [Anaerolineae bacterium]|nr:tetratricopeptide repeat protein [Anaerolineae bacterium]